MMLKITSEAAKGWIYFGIVKTVIKGKAKGKFKGNIWCQRFNLVLFI